MVSIECLLATRFAGNQENVSLRMDIDDGDRKGMMQACAAMIDPGNTANLHLADAGVFGKPLFVSGGSTIAQAATPSGFRLYGTDQDKAQVLGERLKDPAAQPAARAIHHRKAAAPGLLNLLEDLIALPRPHSGL
tara:strand:+ start:136848 stop:137252 length:405 start_codon:yes stop_codon:yes gene_type:complete